MHPIVRARMKKFINKNKKKKMVILDIPLLLENKIKKKDFTLVFVDAKKKEIIKNLKKRKNYKIHTATKVFQALRIFVNKEISELIYGLINSFKLLPVGGVIVIVTFHSI